jgi:hypothetical protein
MIDSAAAASLPLIANAWFPQTKPGVLFLFVEG